jgi:cobalt-zinc-cadmium efflux system outer membrane protein
MPDLRHEARAEKGPPVMRTLSALAFILFTAACGPTAIDEGALLSAADARTRDAGTSQATLTRDVRALMARPLTAESAAQVALANNRGVRGIIEELGIAEARATQARRLPNPTLEGAMRFEGEGRPELEVGAMIDVTDLLLLATRSSAAGAEVEAAKLSAVGALLDLAYDTRRAFYVHQAASELAELRRTVLRAFTASFDLATRLREAGNITELDLANERSFFEEARLELQAAELGVLTARERLNALMGLWGRGTEWRTDARLPEIPAAELSLEKLEATTIERSIDLAIARQRFTGAARRANAAQAQGWLPELKAGVSAERSDEWAVGPAVELEVPLFYQGQGEAGVAKSQMRQQQNVYTELAVTLRARARNAGSTLSAKREALLYYRSVLLPLKQQVVDQSQLEYNAMLIGLFQLLQAKRDQIQTAAAYVEHQRDYWIARTNVEQLLAGRQPPEDATGDARGTTPSPGAAEGAH